LVSQNLCKFSAQTTGDVVAVIIETRMKPPGESPNNQKNMAGLSSKREMKIREQKP
jgi:hypothetical protein